MEQTSSDRVPGALIFILGTNVIGVPAAHDGAGHGGTDHSDRHHSGNTCLAFKASYSTHKRVAKAHGMEIAGEPVMIKRGVH